MSTIESITNDLLKIESEFNQMVYIMSKELTMQSSESQAKPKYNPETMMWEVVDQEHDNIDWGDFEEIKEELKVDLEAFTVPVLDYCFIENK